MDGHMATKDVDGINKLHVSIYNIPYNLLYMKEPDYIINIMSTCGNFLFPTG